MLSILESIRLNELIGSDLYKLSRDELKEFVSLADKALWLFMSEDELGLNRATRDKLDIAKVRLENWL